MRRLAVLVVLLLVIAGCSNRLGYRFADTFIEWRLADYVTLSGALDDQVSASIDALHVWHAQTQLPLYRDTLIELRTLIINNDLTEADVFRYSTVIYGWWENVRIEVEPYALLYVPQLNESQRWQILKKLNDDIEERRQEIADTEFTEVLQRSQKRMEKSLSGWIGRLESSQTRYLKSWLRQREDTREQWLSYQQLWRDEFAEVLLNTHQPEQFERRLQQLILQPEQLRPAELQVLIEQGRETTLQMIYALYETLTPRQKYRLVRTLDDYISDLDSLIAAYANSP